MINKDNLLSLDKMCRSCMSEAAEMKSVYETNPDSVQIADMIMACTTVQVTSSDGLPNLICPKCEEQLNIAYIFKQKCEQTDSTLREYISHNLPNSIKEENESLDIVVKPDIDVLEIYDNDNDAGRNDDDDEDDDGFSGTESVHSNYSTSVRRKKKAQKNRQCKFCSKVLSTKEGLKLHERRHTGEKLKSCPVCQATFAKSNHLLRHMSLHNKPTDEYKHTCQSCGMGFTKASHLHKHLREHKDSPQSPTTDNSPNETVKTEIDSDTEPSSSRKKKTKLHSCEICLKAFSKINHLNRHMLTHGLEKKDKNEPKEKKYMACEFCDRKFVYRKSFLHHIQLEHQISEDSDTPLSEFATIVTKSKQEASISLENDNPDFDEFLNRDENKKIHTCHVCSHKFTRANHLTRHMTLHRAVLVHKCDRCEKAFMTPEHLATHVQEYHVERPYVCSLCNKPFSRGEHLIRHLKVHDKDSSGSDEHKCSICEKIFARSDHLARHTKLHLAQDKRHVCSECGKAFNRLDNLRTHSRIHSGVRDPQRLHLCIYCGKEFNNSSNMIVHMRRHTGERPYKCAQCGKGFPRSHDLKCHERTHSGEKPYLCTLCGKSFNKSNKLLRHTRVHTGERPYVCSLCGRAFTQSNDLALHMRRHTGSRPYACGMCPARFIQSGQLKAHRRSQGHWLETQPELKGAHRVQPVTPLVNPPPIKFKTRVQRIKEEPSILGHTIGLIANPAVIPNVVKETEALTKPETPLDNTPNYHQQNPNKDLKMEEVHNFSRDGPTFTNPQEPGPSFSNNIIITSNSFVVSEGYNTYQTYG